MPDTLVKDTAISLGRFEVISDIEEPQFEVMLSYAGKQFNHCGIQVRATGNIRGEAIHQVIQISNFSGSDVAKVASMGAHALVASISSEPTVSTHGELFTIKTRNGESLASVFSGLSERYKISAIVETYQCD